MAVFVYSNTANRKLKEDIWRAEKVRMDTERLPHVWLRTVLVLLKPPVGLMWCPVPTDPQAGLRRDDQATDPTSAVKSVWLRTCLTQARASRASIRVHDGVDPWGFRRANEAGRRLHGAFSQSTSWEVH